MPSSPLLVLSLVLATLYAAAFHLLWGKSGKGLLVSWMSAVLGFAVGQILAASLGWRDVLIGELHLLGASLFCWLFMFLASRLRL